MTERISIEDWLEEPGRDQGSFPLDKAFPHNLFGVKEYEL